MIYLREAGGEYIGPFKSRRDAERFIIDKDVRIPAGFSVGYRPEDDARRFTVTESGVVVIARGDQIEKVV